MMKKVRWGIVGAGHIANTFAADMQHVANADLTSVAARNLTSANEFAERYDINKTYEGYAALYADPDVDAIYIATPHTLHLPNASDALRAGKAVMCEKPITVSAAECRALIEVAEDTENYLMEAMWTWFLPAIQQAKVWIDAGRIGKLQHLKAELGYPKHFDPNSRLFDPLLAGGCLLDMGIYPIAIAQYFVEKTAKEIQVVSKFAANGVDDDVAMLFDYDDCVATLATSFRYKLPNTAYLIGSEGFIEIPNAWSATECHLYKMHDKVDSFRDNRSGSGFEFQIAAASSDILQGRKQSEVVSHSASLAFQQQMDRVRATF